MAKVKKCTQPFPWTKETVFFYTLPMDSLTKKKTLKDFMSTEAYILAVAIILYKAFVYSVSRLLIVGDYHDLATPYEDLFPFLPGFVYIYMGCYVFWVVNYVMALRRKKEESRAFAAADFLGETVAFLFFIFYPCTMVRPEILGTSFTEKFLSYVYLYDAPNNLLPSLHCFNSWLCWIGVRKNPKIARGYRIFSLLFAIVVCVSTLAIKQHVYVDCIFGVALAEFCWWMGKLLFAKKKS